jgi:hypothetical protein
VDASAYIAAIVIDSGSTASARHPQKQGLRVAGSDVSRELLSCLVMTSEILSSSFAGDAQWKLYLKPLNPETLDKSCL